MAFTEYYTPPQADVASAAYRIGSGQQQDLLNRQAIQQQQFGVQVGLDQQNLNERARQFDQSFGEQVRQFDTSTGIQQEQFGAQQQLAQREVAQRGFLTMAGMWNQNQQLDKEIEARERMAMFNRQAQLEQMGYGASLEAASRLYGMQQQVNLQQQMQQQEQEAQLQYLNKLRSSGQISDMDFAQAQAQIKTQVMGIQTQDPTFGMDPAMKEQYLQDMATTQAKETQRMVQASTGRSIDAWRADGVGWTPDGRVFQFDPVEIQTAKIELERMKLTESTKAETLKQEQAQQQRIQDGTLKLMQQTIPDGKTGGTKPRYATYEDAYRDAVKIFGNMTGATTPPAPGAERAAPVPFSGFWDTPTFSQSNQGPLNAVLNKAGLHYESADPIGKKASVSGNLMPSVPAPTPAPNLTEWRARRAALLAK